MSQNSQRHFGARAWHGHNLAIFHPILTNEYTKMTCSSRRIEWNKYLSSISLFYILDFGPILLQGLSWAMLYIWTRNYPQIVGTCPGHHGQLIYQNFDFSKIGICVMISFIYCKSPYRFIKKRAHPCYPPGPWLYHVKGVM